MKPLIQVIQTKNLDDLGRFSRIVRLETREGALLGNIESVKLDPTNGDILTADLRASKRLYRFDANGNFKLSYGRHGLGPGEYETLVDFAVTDEGTTVLLTTFKLIAFAQDGQLLREARLGLTGFRISAWGDRLAVYGMKAPPRSDWVVWVYNESLKQEHAFHPPDPRMADLLYLPREIAAADSDRLFVSEPYDFALTVYKKEVGVTARYRLPNDNHKLDATWQNFIRSDANVQKIGMGLHRIENLHAFNGWLHFQELGQGGNIFRVNLLDPERHVIYRFQGARPVLAGPSATYLSMDAITGRFPKGIIGVLYDPEKFDRHKHRYPLMSHMDFKDTDNPLLLFFEYHKPERVAQEMGGSN